MGDHGSSGEVGSRTLEPGPPVLRGGAVAKHCLLGAPMVPKYLPFPWQDVRTPRFPVLFPAMGSYALGIFAVVTAVIGRLDLEALAGWICYWFMQAVLLFLVAELANGLLLLWCGALVAVRARLKKTAALPFCHVQRVVYFSSLWQSVALVCGIVWTTWVGPNDSPEVVGILLGLALVALLLLRVLSIFYGLLRSGTGVVIAGAGVVGTLDAWLLGAALLRGLSGR